MRGIRWCVAMPVLVVFAAASFGVSDAITTEEVLAKIAKAEAEVKSFESDTRTVSVAGPKERKFTVHFAVEFIVKDGGPAVHRLYRKTQIKMPDGEAVTMLHVYDGEFMWTERKKGATGKVNVTKDNPGILRKRVKGKLTIGEASVALRMSESFDLKLISEEMVDGQKTWVLEGPATGPSTTPGKIRISVGQNDLAARQSIFYDKKDKKVMEMQFSNVKVNQQIDPALFKYTPPEGATVEDQTNPREAQGTAVPTENLIRTCVRGLKRD